jgi:hypothetical protein
MRATKLRTGILFCFILLTIFCYGAGMMDYFAVYETWKLVPPDVFPQLHQQQGFRIMNIFVIPSAVMTLFNIASIILPASYANKKLLWISLIAYAFDWIFSFTMQIPIQLQLSEAWSLELINELLRTNWYRFAADTIQFLAVCVLLYQFLITLSLKKDSRLTN